MKYDELLNEIELQLVRKSLEIPANLVPTITKIIVPKDIWDELNKDRYFKICIQHKPLYRSIEVRINKKTYENKWFKIIPTPNLGGIPIELGDKIEVIVEGKPAVKRKFKKDAYTTTYS